MKEERRVRKRGRRKGKVYAVGREGRDDEGREKDKITREERRKSLLGRREGRDEEGREKDKITREERRTR